MYRHLNFSFRAHSQTVISPRIPFANSHSASLKLSYLQAQDQSQIPGCSLGSDPRVWILELRQDHAASSSVPAPGLVFCYYTSLLPLQWWVVKPVPSGHRDIIFKMNTVLLAKR